MSAFGNPPGIDLRSYMSIGAWVLGWPDLALARARDGVRIARDLGHLFGLAQALFFQAIAHSLRGEVAAQRVLAAETVALSEAQGFALWLGVGRAWEAAVRVAGGEREAISDLLSGLALAETTGNQAGAPTNLGLLAEAHLAAGQLAEARGAAEAGLAIAAQTGQHLGDADLHRLLGEIVLADGGATADAEAAFLRSLEVARGQEAKSLELRTATRLARLWRHDRRDEARALLAPVYGGFTEGFATRDLVDAKALLDQLG
jgi:predicted ATPase